MWLIVPLIFVLSWRTTRRFGQAFNETVAWVVGYFGTAGILWLADFGGMDLIDTRPNGPGALIAVLGGFAGMLISRWRWKRRGGHLTPRRDVMREIAGALGRASAGGNRGAGRANALERGPTGSDDFLTATGRMLGRAAASVFVPELRRKNPWIRAFRAFVAGTRSQRK
ncbi:hypothetical protein OO015_02400 [Thermomicrobium sp. 4228-Ro]|uniref:hypothetical protein n=1 Tax=Thermomicrobium sp. 4228-Ro TaxID=2993937 RepID=UPI00224961F8|nr:hypothetical protein [Thermomicrobium sp. 4228-Ro]MCX2726343.1 hypothetical protein [Thermomicrobium sp. 4228-Ro]